MHQLFKHIHTGITSMKSHSHLIRLAQTAGEHTEVGLNY